jgi:hypothetical protein
MLYRTALATAWFLTMTAAACAEILWGVNGHPISSYPGIEIGQQLEYIKDLGMKSYRVNISHAKEASKLTALVKEAKAHGIEILPVITPGNIDLENDSAEQLYDKAHTLAVKLGSQFKDEIRVWELGNEMETFAIIKACEKRDDGSQYPCEWGDAGGVGMLEYYGPRWVKVSAVLKGLSDGMILVDPEIRKAMGTAGWGHVGAFERMKRDGIEWDISVWHMYGEDPEWAFRILAGYGRPIWVTEFNNQYGSQRSEEQQAAGLKRAMMNLRALQGTYKVEAAHIYELLDETYWAPNFEGFMGLVRLLPKAEGGWRIGEPKPAYFTVREVIRGLRPLPRPRRDCDLAEVQTIDSVPLRQASFAQCLILGRKGDSATVGQWADALESGETSVAGLLMTLILSDEFSELYFARGLSDRAYVSFLYRLLVDRDADGYGLDSYARQLAEGGMTRESVAYGMILSSEFQKRHRASLAAGS